MPGPNVVFVFADQWRAQATGYAGDPNVRTPNLDRLAAGSVNFVNAVSGCPVCSPYRASLLTGQYPLTHGIFVNDLYLSDRATSLAQAFARGGYNTAYIGKWHVDGHGRTSYIPPSRRQGFDFWRVLECTHEYNCSPYYAGDSDRMLTWDGYDAIDQTRCAIEYIRGCDRDKPFLLVLSWGPPHNPYQTAPDQFRAMYEAEKLRLRPNVREGQWMPNLWGDVARIRNDLAGYYAHCSALDDCMGALLAALEQAGLADETIFVLTSDHGDMLGSQGHWRKQHPYDESVRVPFLLRWPGGLGAQPRSLAAPIDAPDIMPTLLGLCGLEIPTTVEGQDFSPLLRGEAGAAEAGSAVLTCVAPFAEWLRALGAKEYRGLRTQRHTYVRDLQGPWLLFDNEADPYQMTNLVASPEYIALRDDLDSLLAGKLRQRSDEFRPTEHYVEKWGCDPRRAGLKPWGE